MSPNTDRKQVVLGQIGKAHGIKGWLRLNSYTKPPENILSYSQLLAELEDEWLVLKIDNHRQQSNSLIVHFKGFDDPEIVRPLVGLELLVDVQDMPRLEEGDFYWHELVGMEVLNEAGLLFGVIDRLLETGANDVLVVSPSDSSIDCRERLIPYVKELVIKRIDTKEKKILVNWEASYLD